MGNSFFQNITDRVTDLHLHRSLTVRGRRGCIKIEGSAEPSDGFIQGYMPPILPEDLYRELEVSRVSGEREGFFGRFFFPP